MLTESPLRRVGVDAIAVKPAAQNLASVQSLDVETVVVDYEGRAHYPEPSTLSSLADAHELLVTAPVRADGFDPLGEDARLAGIPDAATRVLVAGNGAYLTDEEAQRAVAPRLRAAREAAPEAWVGTEGLERLALAAGGTQFELLSRRTEAEVRALRAAGFDSELALYAPTALTADSDETLDALGDYVARRGPVQASLPADAPTDSRAEGRAREVLLEAATDYALVGDVETVAERVADLEAAGVDRVVAHPAQGLDAFR